MYVCAQLSRCGGPAHCQLTSPLSRKGELERLLSLQEPCQLAIVGLQRLVRRHFRTRDLRQGARLNSEVRMRAEKRMHGFY
jgi:hypothetical protein